MHLISDLHLELACLTQTVEEVWHQRIQPWVDPHDHLALAGDIGSVQDLATLRNFLRRCREYVDQDRHIFFVPGNHEYYGFPGTIDEANQVLAKLCKEVGVTWLQCQVVYVPQDNVYVLGCTLWSQVDEEGFTAVNDGQHIADFQGSTGWQVYQHRHNAEVTWLQEQLRQHPQAIVITHHLPSYRLIHPKFAGSPCNSAFASNLDLLAQQAQVWVGGHTHEYVHAKIGNCWVVANPVGYPGERRVTKVRKCKVC